MVCGAGHHNVMRINIKTIISFLTGQDSVRFKSDFSIKQSLNHIAIFLSDHRNGVKGLAMNENYLSFWCEKNEIKGRKTIFMFKEVENNPNIGYPKFTFSGKLIEQDNSTWLTGHFMINMWIQLIILVGTFMSISSVIHQRFPGIIPWFKNTPISEGRYFFALLFLCIFLTVWLSIYREWQKDKEYFSKEIIRLLTTPA